MTSRQLSSAGDWQLLGEGTSSNVGRVAELLPDVTGDGTPDIAIGSYQVYNPDEDTGAIYLLSHLDTGLDTIEDAADVILRGDDANSEFGADATALDIDGDGFASGDGLDDLEQDGHTDLGVTSRSAGTGVSHAFAYYGPFSTAQTLLSHTDADIVLEGDGVNDTYLTTILAGDTDGDAVPDLIVGSPYGGNDDQGVFYIIPGIGY